MNVILRRSTIDPSFYEIVEEGVVVQEIAIAFLIKNAPSFDSVDEAIQWIRETEWKGAKNTAYRWLSARSYPKPVLKKKLRGKGFSSEVSDRVIADLERLGLLNDTEDLQRAAEKEFRKGYGPRYVAMKLNAMGLDGEKAAKMMDEKRQIDAIRKWLAKKDPKKAARALYRRGFDPHLIQKELD